MASRAVGIDVGGSTIKAARVDRQGRIEGLVQIPTPDGAATIADLCGYLAADLMADDVAAIGIGSAGYVDRVSGVHVWGPHVAGPAPIVAAVVGTTGRSAVIDNDANAAAFAESRIGAAAGYADALVIMLGTGIGGGLIIDGSVYRGRGFAGELGHLVVDPDGPPCACGRRGCWENFVSGSVLDQEAIRIFGVGPTGDAVDAAPAGELLMRAAIGGDADALAVWLRAGEWLGRGIAQLVAVLDPEVVVVGGGPARAGDLLLDPAREVFARERHAGRIRPATQIVPARFEQNAAVIGAGLQALESIDD